MNLENIQKDMEFLSIYKKIIEDFGFSEKKDKEARENLKQIITEDENYSLSDTLKAIQVLISKFSEIIILGGGPDSPTFMENLSKISSSPIFNSQNVLIIAIDGATELLYEYDIIPHLIFTDLDGIQYSTINDPRFDDTFFIIHAHGDNIDLVDKFESLISSKNIIGTTQVQTNLPVVNSGGFTDGDRALYFLMNFVTEMQTIYLVGFDFGDIIGEYSKPTLNRPSAASEIKKKKLEYGAKIIQEICTKSVCNFIFLEINHHYILKNESKALENCKFVRVESEDAIKAILPLHLLFLPQKC